MSELTKLLREEENKRMNRRLRGEYREGRATGELPDASEAHKTMGAWMRREASRNAVVRTREESGE